MIAALSIFASVAPMMAAAFVAGVANTVFIVSYLTLRAALTPERLLGRVGSTARMITLGFNPIGMLAAGVLLDLLGGAATLVAMGVISLVVAILSGLSGELRRAGMPQAATTC
jgi:hypothetical protein